MGWLDFLQRKELQQPSGRWHTVHDPYPGAWQQDVSEPELSSVLAFSAVYACLRLISADVSKMRAMLVRQDDGIWVEHESSPFAAVLRKPNRHQTRLKFLQNWILAKLIHGNAYILKVRDDRGVVRALHVLDSTRVEPLIADTGEAFYRLKRDSLNGSGEGETLPASEIIHDPHITLEHPLIGVSPIAACGLASAQGLAIQRQSTAFFNNAAHPGGILTAPGAISQATAERLKDQFQARYGGQNAGHIAVAGDGLKFQALALPAADAQLIEQLGWTAEDVARAFGVPRHKLGLGELPPRISIAELNQAYYADTLQSLVTQIEVLLTQGLELPTRYEVRLDVDRLLRMDQSARFDAHARAVRAGWKSPNEIRALENLRPVRGGDLPMLQEQMHSLEALADRDERAQLRRIAERDLVEAGVIGPN